MSSIIDFDGKGYNDKECLAQVKILKKVMFKTHAVKTGRGKKAIVTQEFVWDTEEDDAIRTKINNTIKHYENKMETLSNKDNQ